MAPSVASTSSHYALVIDAGSSGSRLQIYSWRDPDLERAEIVKEVRASQATVAASLQDDSLGGGSAWPWEGKKGGRKWWWPSMYLGKGKGKGKEFGVGELEKRALRRLVRVGKGVEGDDWVKKVEPGISTRSPNDIPSYIAPLLEHAMEHIPPSQHAQTPIYLYATAGMRLLPADERNAILKATCDTLRANYPFHVEAAGAAGPCGESIRVISGDEEGIWGWVAVNYLMDGFGHTPTDNPASMSSALLPLSPLAEAPIDSTQESVTPVDVTHRSPTFGFLDMGGASTQIAFSPTKHEISQSGFPQDQLRKVSLRLLSGEQVDWPLFVHSWLGFGTNQARDRYVAALLEQWKATNPADLTTPIRDPCLPVDLLLPSSHDDSSPPFQGTGAFAQCLNSLIPLLERSHKCETDHCLFGGISTPKIDFLREDQRGFIGVSEYWYTAHQVLGLGGVWDWGEWEKGMGTFCSRDWKSVEEELEKEKGWRGAQVELSRLQMQCFKGAWISNVLHEGIGIPRLIDRGGEDTLTGGEVGDTNAEAERRAREKGLLGSHKSHFQSMDEVGETAISWTLGKMVIEASKAVPPRSLSKEQAWRDRLPLIKFGMGRTLENAGIEGIWVYIILTSAIMLLVFNWIRRSRGHPLSASRNSGRRKQSFGLGSPFSTSPTSWSFLGLGSGTPGAREREREEINLEDGYDISRPPSPSFRSKSSSGTIRKWSIRIANSVKRNIPFGPHRLSGGGYDTLPRVNGRATMARHASMPVHSSSTQYSPSYSQPASPQGGYFTPAHLTESGEAPDSQPGSLTGPPTNGSSGGLGIPFTRSLSTSPEPRRTTLSGSASAGDLSAAYYNQTSPPRNKRPLRARQNSSHTPPLTNAGTAGMGTSGGWNDPPSNLLDPISTQVGPSMRELEREKERKENGSLTPSASTGGAGTISRQSSRVNLSELGLKERSASRMGNHEA